MFQKYLREYKEWCLFFNVQMTLFIAACSFTIMQSSQHKAELIVLVFLFVGAISWRSGKFPSLIIAKRKAKLNESQKAAYAGLMKRYFGLKASFTYFLPYTLSCVFAAKVAVDAWS